MGSQRLLALCSSIVIATRLKATYASSRESDRDFVIMLVYDAASDGKIRACEHGSRAGQRASDRLTHRSGKRGRNSGTRALASALLID